MNDRDRALIEQYAPVPNDGSRGTNSHGRQKLDYRPRPCVACGNQAIGAGLRCGPCYREREATQEAIRRQRRRDRDQAAATGRPA